MVNHHAVGGAPSSPPLAWGGLPVAISVQMLPKYVWTQGALEIFLDGRSVFRTVEYAVSGSRDATFFHAGQTHTLNIDW